VFDGAREKWNRTTTPSTPKEARTAATIEVRELCRIDGFFERAQSVLVSL
jgi:hypothetical protein